MLVIWSHELLFYVKINLYLKYAKRTKKEYFFVLFFLDKNNKKYYTYFRITTVNKNGGDFLENISITNAEWQVVKVICANPDIQSGEISKILCERFEWKNATVKTLIHRLLEKKVIKNKQSGKKYLYYTDFSIDDLAKQMMQSQIEKICSTKVGKIIVSLIDKNELSFKDLDDIKKALENKKQFAVDEVKCNCIPGQCDCNHESCCGHRK